MTPFSCGSSTLTWTNWPGVSLPSGLSISARTATSRLEASTLGSIPVILPVKGRSSPWAPKRTGWPIVSSGIRCSGTVKSARSVSRSWSVATMVPGVRYCPTSTRGMPIVPANGARSFFWRSSASSFWTCAAEAEEAACAASRLAVVPTPFSLSSIARWSDCWSRAACVSAALRSACSISSSSWQERHAGIDPLIGRKEQRFNDPSWSGP